MSSHLMQASHCQWIYHNFTLHDRQRGYLRLKQRRDLLREVDKLIHTPPDEIPDESKYLLKLDGSALYNASFERQSYWVLAMKAMHWDGWHKSVSGKQEGQHKHLAATRKYQHKPCYNFTCDEEQMRQELSLQLPSRRHPHSDANGIGSPSNKRLRKPD
jgi:hypothetical protein